MKFLVLGCNGMAGHMVSCYLFERGHDVLGFDRNKSSLISSISGDARDTLALKEIIDNGHFDTVINCIGILNQFAEQNKALATFLNSYFPHFLAEVTDNTYTQVIQMSTDCVFSGKRGQYTEDEFPDGETFYDRSKALGELKDNKNITLRDSIVGPDINPNGIGLLNWFMKSTKGDNPVINGYTKTMWTGLTTIQLAKAMEVAATEKVSGLYNTVPDHSISKCDLIRLFNHYLRHDKAIITPVDGLNTDKSLKRTRFELSYRIPDYEFMVAELADWIKAHKDLYKHYEVQL